MLFKSAVDWWYYALLALLAAALVVALSAKLLAAIGQDARTVAP